MKLCLSSWPCTPYTLPDSLTSSGGRRVAPGLTVSQYLQGLQARKHDLPWAPRSPRPLKCWPGSPGAARRQRCRQPSFWGEGENGPGGVQPQRCVLGRVGVLLLGAEWEGRKQERMETHKHLKDNPGSLTFQKKSGNKQHCKTMG